MKTYTITICLLLILTGIFSSCKKEDSVGNVQLLSYTFEPASNPGLSNRVEGTIQGNDVFIRVPNSIDINQAIPSFTVNSEKFVAFVGNTVQESGISQINLADTTTYRFLLSRRNVLLHCIRIKKCFLLIFWILQGR